MTLSQFDRYEEVHVVDDADNFSPHVVRQIAPAMSIH